MTNRIISMMSFSLFFAALLGEAVAATINDLTFVPGIETGWAYYQDGSSRNGGRAGEWTAQVDGRAAVGYFSDPWRQTMTSGVVTNLASVSGAYEAAWLIDQFALGLGNDGIPAGWSGGSVSNEEKRTALAFAVYEVCRSPESDPPELDDGYFWIWYGPSLPQQLGQAYLDAMTNATLDEAELEAKYDIVIGDQWTGYGYAEWIVSIEQPVLTQIDVSPTSVVLNVGQSTQFSALGRDQYGYLMALDPAWSATGGRIGSNGLYTAISPGAFNITAAAADSPVLGTGVVTATAMPITNVSADAQASVTFPSYTTTVYTLQSRTSLTTGSWTIVPGAGPTRGTDGGMALSDTNALPSGTRFYRVQYIVTP